MLRSRTAPDRPAEAGARPTGPTVRRLGPGDEAVLALLARDNDRFGSLEDRVALDPLPPAEAAAFLADDRTALFVAFVGDEPAGFVYTCELYRRHTVLRHLCLYEVGVADQHRGRGIGPALMAAVADHAKAQGIERGFTVTHTSNVAALALFAEAGGQRTADDDAVFAFDWSG